MKEALHTLGAVVHTLQRERGCTAVFLYSEGKLFHDRMHHQFSGSDSIIQSWRKDLEHWSDTNSIGSQSARKLQELLTLCLDLPQWRQQITDQTIASPDCINHYSHRLIGSMLQAMVEIALSMENSNPTCVSAYNALLHWKERIGLERAIGARGFVGYGFHNAEFVERLAFLFSEQDAYKNTYLALANDEQKALVVKAFECEEVRELHRIHGILKESPEDAELYALTPESWFDLISTKIDALLRVEKGLIDSLTKKNAPQKSQQPATGHSSPSEFGDYEKLICSLRLFSDLSTEAFGVLLRNGQIRDFSKGKLLFLEGEPANRLYVVLRGWVKIFKGTVNGDETVLQMLSGGDSILESAVFLNSSFPLSAQVVQNATILSIPAPILREHIKGNNILARNLLATMSHRSQGLIRQIESTRLKTVDERIGWFLLKLLMDQGRISRCVDLPYDKSLIASYLDMKRETFSRGLKRMKEKGFRVENDTVVIPEIAALCDFCDTDTANQCAIHGTSKCPKTQAENSSMPADFLERRAV